MDGQGDLVAEGLAATWEIHLPVEAEVVTIDLGLEVYADPLVLTGIEDGAADLAAGDDRLGVALDGQLAVDDQLVALPRDLLRLEDDLGVLLGVEEVRRQEMSVEVLLLDLNAVDLRPPGYLRATGGVADAGVELVEAAAEGPNHVLDGEPDARMDRIGLPAAGRDG